MIRHLILNNIVIESRKPDNFINATQMCKAGGKLFGHWSRLDSTKELIKTLEISLKNKQINIGKKSDIHICSSDNSSEMQNNEVLLNVIDVKKGGDIQGSWIHPHLAVQLAQWISPSFAIQVSEWIYELFETGSVSIKQLDDKDKIISDMQKQLAISESKCLNLITHIKSTNIHKIDGYVYLATCDQYANSNHYRFGRSIDVEKRLTGYQVGRTIKDQMGVVFTYEAAKSLVLENTIRGMLVDFAQDSRKDIYVISWPLLLDFVTTACEAHTAVIQAKNKLVEQNIMYDNNLIIPPIISLDEIKQNKYYPKAIKNISEECDSDSEISPVIEIKEPVQKPKLVKEVKKKIIKCDKCNKEFTWPNELARHMRRKKPCALIIESTLPNIVDDDFISIEDIKKQKLKNLPQI